MGKDKEKTRIRKTLVRMQVIRSSLTSRFTGTQEMNRTVQNVFTFESLDKVEVEQVTQSFTITYNFNINVIFA